MEEFLEMATSVDRNGFDVIRLIVAPILSTITAIIAISVFAITYIIVFRIKKYLKMHKTYLNFTNKLLTSFNHEELQSFRAYETTMWGSKLANNKKIVGEVLSNYKTADLKDLILGTYNDDLKSIKSIIKKDKKLIQNNKNFIKFQKLFHTYKNNEVILEYLNNEYISFYKVCKSGVIIGILKKQILKDKGIEIKYNINCSDVFENELKMFASIYTIYFIKRKFVYKNISNPIPEFEEKILSIRKLYVQVFQKKYFNQNVYLKNNFFDFPKINNLLKTGKCFIQNEFLVEISNQKQINLDKIISEKLRNRKEIKKITKNKF